MTGVVTFQIQGFGQMCSLFFRGDFTKFQWIPERLGGVSI